MAGYNPYYPYPMYQPPVMDQLGQLRQQQFQQFMSQMQGRDPKAMLDELVSSGRVSQEQLNAAQQRAQELAGLFQPMDPRK